MRRKALFFIFQRAFIHVQYQYTTLFTPHFSNKITSVGGRHDERKHKPNYLIIK